MVNEATREIKQKQAVSECMNMKYKVIDSGMTYKYLGKLIVYN